MCMILKGQKSQQFFNGIGSGDSHVCCDDNTLVFPNVTEHFPKELQSYNCIMISLLTLVLAIDTKHIAGGAT